MVHEEKVYCNTSYVQVRWVNVLLLGLATIKTYVYACDFHHWHFFDKSNPEPYLCMGFDCGLWVSASIITLTKTSRSVIISKICSLLHQLLSQSLFWWLQYHCTTGIKTFFECHVLKVM
jgi:hypothetical protein